MSSTAPPHRRPCAPTRPCPVGLTAALRNRPVESNKIAFERVLLCLRRQALPQTRESDQILSRFGILGLVSHLQAVRCQEMIIAPMLHGALLRPLLGA